MLRPYKNSLKCVSPTMIGTNNSSRKGAHCQQQQVVRDQAQQPAQAVGGSNHRETMALYCHNRQQFRHRHMSGKQWHTTASSKHVLCLCPLATLRWIFFAGRNCALPQFGHTAPQRQLRGGNSAPWRKSAHLLVTAKHVQPFIDLFVRKLHVGGFSGIDHRLGRGLHQADKFFGRQGFHVPLTSHRQHFAI